MYLYCRKFEANRMNGSEAMREGKQGERDTSWYTALSLLPHLFLFCELLHRTLQTLAGGVMPVTRLATMEMGEEVKNEDEPDPHFLSEDDPYQWNDGDDQDSTTDWGPLAPPEGSDLPIEVIDISNESDGTNIEDGGMGSNVAAQISGDASEGEDEQSVGSSEDSVTLLIKCLLGLESSLELPGNSKELLKIRIPAASNRRSIKAIKKVLQEKITRKASIRARKTRHSIPSTSPGKQRLLKASSSKARDDTKLNSSRSQRTRRVLPRPDFENAIRDWPIGDAPSSLKDTRRPTKSETGTEKRSRGHPPKAFVPMPSKELTEWSVLVYISIEQPSRVVQTSKRAAKKLEIPEPKQRGPITVTHSMTWSQFLKEIARANETGVENIPIQTMRWTVIPSTTMSKARSLNDLTWLPVTCEVGYRGFIDDGIKATKGKGRFLLSMSPALLTKGKSVEGQMGPEEDREVLDESEEEGEKRVKKKTKRLPVDSALQPIKERLLNETTYDKIPINNIFFGENRALKGSRQGMCELAQGHGSWSGTLSQGSYGALPYAPAYPPYPAPGWGPAYYQAPYGYYHPPPPPSAYGHPPPPIYGHPHPPPHPPLPPAPPYGHQPLLPPYHHQLPQPGPAYGQAAPPYLPYDNHPPP
ncbi:hypothetical protein BD309DRAFT_984615 [Dichomitus squalens]|uniref:Uncharacterized protein n=1 Tax=Dichomitus squalens TaxID=114155 RepID=A0A4Q9PGJ7_9APHY|nr:hypothetical protein BD309DRAFT_984615 [Dichomitus squalens]TBU52382.1 hypothetical protein BD310DRAFT_910120 [Dichomitus squalens]